MIRASLASIPARVGSLERTVASLLPQVDRLGVYLNGYGTVPGFLDDVRIDVARSEEYGDRGDGGKFFWSDADDFDYHISCDDDLIYPPDFAASMVAGVERYRRRALVGLHGAMMQADPKDYYRSRAKVYHCLADVAGDHPVHVIATATLCWHRSMPITPDIFKHPNMADMWVSAWANERDIPRIVLAHEKGWVRATKPKGGTIWDAASRKQGGPMDTSAIQGRIARETPWRVSAPPRLDAVVSIVTYKRADALRRLLGDVERERERFVGDVGVRVYDDASPGYDGIRKLCRARGYSYVRAPEHYGKAKHWRLIGKELSDLRAVPADWYFFLSDDIRLREHFFARAIAAWETLDRPAAMNLAHHSARPGSCWTRIEPREVGAGVENGWVDGLYVCRRPMLELLDFGVPMPSQQYADNWLAKQGSTGVGAVVSRDLVGKGAKLYRVQRSLTNHQGVASIMHPKERKAHPQAHVDPVEPFATHAVGAAQIAADADDHVGKVIAGGEWYEADVLAAVKATGASGLYLDVGAHVGNHTAYFATECGASVLAIEPNAANYARLVATVEASGIGERVRTVRAAVHPTWKTGRVVPGPAGNSGMTRIADGGDEGTVPVVRLDELVKEERVGLVKVDVEGNALGVLETARGIIERDHPVVVAEAGAQKDAVTELLGGMGYGEPIGHYGWTPVWFWLCPEHTRPPAPEPKPKKAQRPAVRLSVAMMAHPKRKASVERILARLDRDCTVVWDEREDRWDTGKRAMLAYDPEATHHVVIQDDVHVCRDLCAGLERALAYVPAGAPLSAYVGRVRPQTETVLQAVAEARARDASFIVMRGLNWGPLVAVPTGIIREMVAHGDKLRKVPNYDRRLSRFFELKRRTSVWYTWPSLVDHADGPSMVKGRFATNHEREPLARVAHEFIGEAASALDVDWTGQVVNTDYGISRGAQRRRRAPRTKKYVPDQPHVYEGPVIVYRHRSNGRELRLPPHSPRVRRLRGLRAWELVGEETA